MASVTLNPGSGGQNVATNAVTRDSTTEQLELIVVADGTNLTNPQVAAVDGNGLHVNVNGALPAGGNNIGSVNVASMPASSIPGVNSSGTGQYIPLADNSAPITATASPTTVVTGVVGKKINVTHFDFIANWSGTVQFVHGAGNTPITGAYAVTPETGLSVGNGLGLLFSVAAGDDLKLVLTATSGSISLAGLISFYQA